MKYAGRLTIAVAVVLIAQPLLAQGRRQQTSHPGPEQTAQTCPLGRQGVCPLAQSQNDPAACPVQGQGMRMGPGGPFGRGMGQGMRRGMGRGQMGPSADCPQGSCATGRGRGQGQCGRGPAVGRGRRGQGRGMGRGAGAGACLSQSTQPLAEAEIPLVKAMRQEEKLARDVYLTLNEKYNSIVFQHIAAAEQRHMDAVGRILSTHQIDDPAADDTVGVFTDPEVAKLYADLIAGGTDYAAALKAGALVEEMDIADLQEAQKAVTNPQVARIFANLLHGSCNHLRAFTASLAAAGETYEPQILAAEVYGDILAAGPAGLRPCQAVQPQDSKADDSTRPARPARQARPKAGPRQAS